MTSDWSLLLRGAWLTACEPRSPEVTTPHFSQSFRTSTHLILFNCASRDSPCFPVSSSYKPATMLRNGAARLTLRSLGAPASRSATNFKNTSPTLQWATQYGSLASRRPRLTQNAMKPIQSAIVRRSAITDAQKQAEGRYSKEEIKPTPETVSTTSSTHAMFGEVGVQDPEQKDADMMAGLNHDVVRADVQRDHSWVSS